MRYLLLYFKGMLMGAADLVPGVSGGTIALITGIYKELLDSINAVSWSTLKLLKKEGKPQKQAVAIALNTYPKTRLKPLVKKY